MLLKVRQVTAPPTPLLHDLMLQDIDHELVANTALKTKLKKDKKLAGNDDLEAAIAQELSRLITPATPGSNLAKVQGRLLSSKVVATEVHTVVEAVRVLVFPELKAPAAPADDDDADDEEDVPAPPTKKAKTSSAAAREVAEASSSEDSSEDDEAEGERVVLDEDDEAVDDGGWESGSVNGGPDSEDEDEESSDGDEESGEDEEDDEESDSAPPPKRQAKSEPSQASSSKSAVKAKAGESTFLPSLSVGFTRGDSDASDLSDGEVAKADGGMKKNRRGQRARRACVFVFWSPLSVLTFPFSIWEKKYGKNANHVKKQEEIAAKNPRDRMRKPFGKPQAGAGAQPGGRPPPHGGSRPQGRPQGTFSKPSGAYYLYTVQGVQGLRTMLSQVPQLEPKRTSRCIHHGRQNGSSKRSKMLPSYLRRARRLSSKLHIFRSTVRCIVCDTLLDHATFIAMCVIPAAEASRVYSTKRGKLRHERLLRH